METPLYEIVEHPSLENSAAVQILDGKYQGVVYRYGTVAFSDPDPITEEVSIKFDWEVVEADEFPELEESQEFTDIVCDVLNTILEREFKIGHGS